MADPNPGFPASCARLATMAEARLPDIKRAGSFHIRSMTLALHLTLSFVPHYISDDISQRHLVAHAGAQGRRPAGHRHVRVRFGAHPEPALWSRRAAGAAAGKTHSFRTDAHPVSLSVCSRLQHGAVWRERQPARAWQQARARLARALPGSDSLEWCFLPTVGCRCPAAGRPWAHHLALGRRGPAAANRRHKRLDGADRKKCAALSPAPSCIETPLPPRAVQLCPGSAARARD